MKNLKIDNLFTKKRRAKKILNVLKKLLPYAKIALHYSSPWELLVAVVLSAQCTDKKVNEVTARLFKKYKILNDYARAKQSEFEKDIHETGFYRNKAKNILAAAKAVKEKFCGKLPETMEEMLTIPGIGRKSANIILSNVYGVVEGIAVDTHVKRLSRLFGLTKETNPEKIERDLMAIIPKKDWAKCNDLFTHYGRQYCPARPHGHKKCPLYSI